MHYRILANPASGRLSRADKNHLLQAAAGVLHAEVHGLDTGSAQELTQCAREQAEQCDVLVVAGGDGTFSMAINAVDLSNTVLAFLPFGTGNALTHALKYRGSLTDMASRIRNGAVHHCDLINCDGRRKAFMASVGFDGDAIRLYEHYRARGYRGLNAHFRSALRAFFKEYPPTGGRISVDGEHRRTDRLMSLAVVKQPYYGMGLNAVPQARWGDGNLHTLLMAAGLPTFIAGLITGFTIGNRVGDYRRGKTVTATLDSPLTLQIDGEVGWTGDRFDFSVLCAVLRLKH